MRTGPVRIRPVPLTEILKVGPLPSLLQLTDLGPTAKISMRVGEENKSLNVLLGLRPNNIAQRFIRDGIVRQELQLRGSGESGAKLWEKTDSRGCVRDPGCALEGPKGLLTFFLTNAKLRLCLPTREEALAIVREKQGQLLESGILYFETGIREEIRGIQDDRKYPVGCSVETRELDLGVNLKKRVTEKSGIVLVEIGWDRN